MKIVLYCLLIVLTPCLAVAGGIKLLKASAISGDKIEGRSEKGFYYISLHGIDAPEKDQPFGDDSTQSLQAVIDNGLPLTVMIAEACPPGVTCVAYVFDRSGWSLSELQVGKGMAWANGDADRVLFSEQKNVRRKSVGLWSDADPIPPWEWQNKREYYEKNRTIRAKIDARTAGQLYTIRDSGAEQRRDEQRRNELAALNRMIKREKKAANPENQENREWDNSEGREPTIIYGEWDDQGHHYTPAGGGNAWRSDGTFMQNTPGGYIDTKTGQRVPIQ